MGCDAQLAGHIKMTYKPSKLGQTDLVFGRDQSASVALCSVRRACRFTISACRGCCDTLVSTHTHIHTHTESDRGRESF